MSAQPSTRSGGSTTRVNDRTGRGWITFAGVMIVIVAALNVLDGVAAIVNSKFFIGGAKFVISDLRTWGWIILVIGCLQLVVAFGIWAGSQLARWTGVAVVSLNLIAQILFLPSYPFLSISIIVIDVLVLYGLAVHGARLELG